MQIDPKMVKWDEPTPQALDPSMVKWDDAPKDSSANGRGGILQNAAGGILRGAGSIGATLLYPLDKAQDLYYGDRNQSLTGLITGGAKPLSRNEERRKAMDDALTTMGADTDSLMFKGGKLVGEIAGTAGAGGVLANGLLRAAPVVAPYAPAIANGLTKLAPAIESGGFTLGAGAPTSAVGNMALRTAGGAISGGATAGLADPNDARTGFLVGGALPGAAKVAAKAGELVADGFSYGAKKLMQSALKPTIKQLQTGDAQTAIDTLLKYGINPTKGGVEKLRSMVGDLNDQIAAQIQGSTATIDKSKVLNALNDTKAKFGSQVSPTSDLAAIDGVASDFLAHPNFPGATIPVADAQAMKQGTYQVLAKKYGQLGGAETEAQKSLARGLKDEIAAAVPGVSALNAEESRLIQTLKVSERRALMDANKNPVGLAGLASNPVSWAAFMADKSALFKSLMARAANNAAAASQPVANFSGGLLANPVARGGLLTYERGQ